MKSPFARVRTRLSFANVVSALALFLALGGTSYAAAQLPFNSVGKGQIKSNAVGKSEIASNSVGTSELRNSGVAAADIKSGAVGPSEVRPNAIDTDELADGGIGAADLSEAAKLANGVTFRASANGDGTGAAGNAKGVAKASVGVYNVDLGADVTACQRVATPTGTDPVFISVAPGATSNVITVRTFAQGAGAPVDSAFNLLVAC
jgi:hypothetical protein